jgi:hypothetical protein
MTSWIDQVRTALNECGETQYRVSQQTGIRVGRLHDFVNCGKNLSATNLENLAKYLGFRLVRKTQKTISENG